MLTPQIARQVLTLTGLFFCSVSDGFILGQMSGMIAALQTPESRERIPLSDSDISWIASGISMTSILGCFLAAPVTTKLGRRRAITILTTPILLNWVLLYFAQRMAVFMISRIIVGVCFGGVLMLSYISTAEYTAPSSRNFCLNIMNSVGPGVGITLGHVLGILLHWRTVALLGIIPTALSAFLPCFFVESPSWLASKGRFEECETAFKKLHPNSDKSNKEMQLLIELEKCKLSKKDTVSWKEFRNLIKQRYFWKIAFLELVLIVYIVSMGKIVLSIYAITILKDITGSSNVIMYTLLIDGFALLGAVISCFLIDKMKMRSLLFSFGIVANCILVTLSLCLYFRPETSYFSWIVSILLAIYLITIHTGPSPVVESLLSELFPLDLKVYFFLIYGLTGGGSVFLSVKITPWLFSTLGYHGVFFLNASIVCFCQIYLWFNLPETKGRTLQEIELYFKNNTFNKIDDLLKGDMKALV